MADKPFLLSGEITGTARFSQCGRFRYVLTRTFRGDPRLHRLCVWMNPSVADDKEDDASVRIGMSFARRWGDGGIVVINVYSLIETHSEKLPRLAADCIGPDHWQEVERAMRGEYGHVKREVLCGWGDRGAGAMAERMIATMRSHGLTPCALALTKSGNPGHPLRKSLATPLRPW